MRSELDEQLNASLQKASDLHAELQVLVAIRQDSYYVDASLLHDIRVSLQLVIKQETKQRCLKRH